MKYLSLKETSQIESCSYWWPRPSLDDENKNGSSADQSAKAVSWKIAPNTQRKSLAVDLLRAFSD